jgi:hypothetical protein
MSDYCKRKTPHEQINSSGLSSSLISTKIQNTSFNLGNPYASQQTESRLIGSHRKFPTDRGWLTKQQMSEISNLSVSKIGRLLKYKTANQIINAE